jgi:hypothetical protein
MSRSTNLIIQNYLDMVSRLNSSDRVRFLEQITILKESEEKRVTYMATVSNLINKMEMCNDPIEFSILRRNLLKAREVLQDVTDKSAAMTIRIERMLKLKNVYDI